MAVSKSYNRNQPIGRGFSSVKAYFSYLQIPARTFRYNNPGHETREDIFRLHQLARAACLAATIAFTSPLTIVAAQVGQIHNENHLTATNGLNSPLKPKSLVFAQERVFEGRLLNLANQPIENATGILDTNNKETALTSADGNYQFKTTQNPTYVRLTPHDVSQLVSGPIRREIFDLTGRVIDSQQGYLGVGQEIDGFNSNDNLKHHNVYIQRITDSKGNFLTKKFVYIPNSNDQVLNETRNMLKSASAQSEDDVQNYKAAFNGPTFKDTILVLPIERTSFYAYNDLRINEKPSVISNYKGERFNADTLNVLLDTLFRTDDALKYALIFNGENNAKINDNILKVYGNSKFDLKATDGINQSVSISGMDFEQYNNLNILITELFSDSLVNNATVKLWDGISKVYEPVKIEGNKHSFEVDNKNQHYQVMITSPDFTERNAFIFMDKNSIDTVMNVISNKFNWEAYKSMYQIISGNIEIPMDVRFPEGIKPIVYLVNSREYIKDNTNPDVEGSLKYIEKHFTEKKTIEHFTYNKINEVKDLEIRWIDSVSQIPDFRAPDQYFVAILMDNKMVNNGSVSYVTKDLTLGTALCRFQTHSDFTLYDNLFKEEVGTAIAGARAPTYFNEEGDESIFQKMGPDDFTQLDWQCSRVYSERHKMDGDNALPPFEGKLSDPNNMKFIFQTYQENENIQNNIYTRFKNLVNEIKNK